MKFRRQKKKEKRRNEIQQVFNEIFLPDLEDNENMISIIENIVNQLFRKNNYNNDIVMNTLSEDEINLFTEPNLSEEEPKKNKISIFYDDTQLYIIKKIPFVNQKEITIPFSKELTIELLENDRIKIKKNNAEFTLNNDEIVKIKKIEN